MGRVLLVLAVAYVALTTADVEVGGLPGKIFVVGAALAAWVIERRLWDRPAWTRLRAEFAFALPVLLVAAAVPVVWSLVAAWHGFQDDPAQQHGLTYAIQEASRFVYLLLYFPLVDEMRRRSFPSSQYVWLVPTFLLCAVTVGLYLGSAVLHLDYGATGTVGPFQGAVGKEATGTFRTFLIDDVMFIPAMAVVLADVRLRGLTVSSSLAAGTVLVSVYLAHARGVWLGVCVTVTLLVLSDLLDSRSRRTTVAVGAVVVAILLAGFVVNAAPTLARDAVSSLSGRNEQSTVERLDQVSQLWDGIERHPLLGSGLGATLPSGFQRDRGSPWSFELTYLQLWFQLGALGLALVLYLPGRVLVKGVRRVAELGPSDRVRGNACLAGLVGLLFTSGANPYLVTSVGMMALAVLVAMADRILYRTGSFEPVA